MKKIVLIACLALCGCYRTDYLVKVRNTGTGATAISPVRKDFKIGDTLNAGYLAPPDIIISIIDSNYYNFNYDGH